MADLITHSALAVIVKASTGWRMPAVFVAGTLLPDIASRVPAIGLGYIHVHLAEIPRWILFAWEPMHQPLGMVVCAYLASLFFSASHRFTVFLNLLGGMVLHMFLDVLQSHHGAGYMLAFPFHKSTFEFGWIGSEATAPFAVPLSLIAGWLVLRRSKRAASGPDT